MSRPPWDLEPFLHEIPDGQLVDLVAEVVVQHPGYVALRSLVHGQSFLSDMKISTGYNKVTLFRAVKTTVNGKCWLMENSQASILGHRPHSISQMHQIIESCAGMAVVDTGYQACGGTMVTANDVNIRFCQWLHNQGKNVIAGDITLGSTVQRISKCPRGCVSAGVACQPWSLLGDQKGGQDPRAQSLPGVLTASHLLQVPAIFLECTTGAEKAVWFQDILSKFSSATGFVVHQKVLHLHELWPAKRSRWWAVLSHPCLGCQGIPDFPNIAFRPSLMHLFSKLPPLTEDQESELSLDRYELRQFACAAGGLSKSVVNFCLPLPTATHSWGSQVKNCQCGCRSAGFSEDRLKEKGLYGQIVPTDGEEHFEGWSAPKMRHLHPNEVSMANGASPKLFGNVKGSLRLELAGIGQSASPIQAIWVYGNFLRDVKQTFGIQQDETPTDMLRTYGQKLFKERDEWLQIDEITKNKYLQLFETAWDNLGSEIVNNGDEWSVKLAKDRENQGRVPSEHSSVASEHSSVTRPTSTENISVEVERIDAAKHPSVASLHPSVAVEHPSVASVHSSVASVHPSVAPEHPCVAPEHLRVAFDQTEVPVDNNNPTNQHEGPFLSVPNHVGQVNQKDSDMDMDDDERRIFEFFHPSQTSKFNEQSSFQNGRVPGFETTSNGKRRKLFSYQPEASIAQGSLVPNNGNGGSSPLTKLPEITEQKNEKEDEVAQTQMDTSDETNETDERKSIYLIRNDQSQTPILLRANKGLEIAEAELKLSCENQVLLEDWLGNTIDPNEPCFSGQLIRVKHEHEDIEWSSPPKLVQCTQGQALWNQRGWVNEQEMAFYLSTLEEVFPDQTMVGCVLPENPMKPFDLGRLLLKGLMQAHVTQKAVATPICGT